MLLKRKRSESELSFSSAFSSPPRPGSSSFDFGAMAMDTDGYMRPSRSTTPAHLPSRTMKRIRDNRPSEAEVHQHTLGLLFSARQNVQASQLPQPQVQQPDVPAGSGAPPTSHSVGQRSLHSFWHLPRSTSTLSTVITTPTMPMALCPPVSPPVQQDVSTSCEDCGAGLGGYDDMMMDVEGSERHSCGACGKMVCFSCCVSNLGEHTRCLACAGR